MGSTVASSSEAVARPLGVLLPGGSLYVVDGSGGREDMSVRLFGRPSAAGCAATTGSGVGGGGTGGVGEYGGVGAGVGVGEEEEEGVDVFGFLAEAEQACGAGDREPETEGLECA
jgi:hypothetical protein